MSSTPYDRQSSFAAYSAENPGEPHSGATLDAEFNAVKVAIDDTQQNLALIQDDDGELKRGIVGQEHFDSSVSIGFGAPSQWAAGRIYTENVDTVFYQSKFYIANTTHTSTVSFEAAKWDEIADFTLAAVIEDGSITSAKLADAAVNASKLADGSISATKIATGAVSTAKLADASVTTAKLADANVTTAKLADASVTAAKVAASAITYAKMQDVTAARLIGNAGGAPAAPSEISLGENLYFSSGALAANQPGLAGAVGLVITNNAGAPNTKIDITIDQVVMVDSTPRAKFASAQSVTVDSAVIGAVNGLSSGSRVADTWYALWYISNGTTHGGLLDTSATAPTMPSGYTFKVRLGWVRTDGSGNFFRSIQRGADAIYNGTTGPRQVTTAVAVAATSLSVANFVPTTATKAKMSAHCNSMVNTDTLGLASASPGTNAQWRAFYANVVASTTNRTTVNADLDLDTPQTVFYVAGNASGCDVRCHGWTDKVNAS